MASASVVRLARAGSAAAAAAASKVDFATLTARVQRRLASQNRLRITKFPELRRAAVVVPLCVHDGIPSVLFTQRSSELRNHSGQVSFPGGLIDAQADGPEPVTHPNTITRAALRELHEELGIAPAHVTVLGLHHDSMTRRPPRAGTSAQSAVSAASTGAAGPTAPLSVTTPAAAAASTSTSTGSVASSAAGVVADADRPLKQSLITPVVGALTTDLSALQVVPSAAEVARWFTLPLQRLLDPQYHTTKYGWPAFPHPSGNPELLVWGATAYMLHQFLAQVVLPDLDAAAAMSAATVPLGSEYDLP